MGSSRGADRRMFTAVGIPEAALRQAGNLQVELLHKFLLPLDADVGGGQNQHSLALALRL